MSDPIVAPDFEALLAEITRARISPDYTEMDRYRDFRQVFMGTDAGKRALAIILGWGHIVRNAAALANHDTNKTQFFNGENNLALRILSTVYVEPKPRPTRAISKRPKEG